MFGGMSVGEAFGGYGSVYSQLSKPQATFSDRQAHAWFEIPMGTSTLRTGDNVSTLPSVSQLDYEPSPWASPGRGFEFGFKKENEFEWVIQEYIVAAETAAAEAQAAEIYAAQVRSGPAPWCY